MDVYITESIISTELGSYFWKVYVDIILLIAKDMGMLHDVRKFLCKNFEMKDMSEASYMIGIEIFLNRSQ